MAVEDRVGGGRKSNSFVFSSELTRHGTKKEKKRRPYIGTKFLRCLFRRKIPFTFSRISNLLGLFPSRREGE